MARLSFACLAAALLTLTASGLAGERVSRDWWNQARWDALSEGLESVGQVLLLASALLLGLTAMRE